jgi:hypothetical protein
MQEQARDGFELLIEEARKRVEQAEITQQRAAELVNKTKQLKCTLSHDPPK